MSIKTKPQGHPLLTRPRSLEGRPGFELTARDVEILNLCYQHRFLDSDQIRALLNATTQGRRQRLKVRLQHLWLHGYLERPKDQLILRVRDRYRPLIYALGFKAIPILAEQKGLDIQKVRWTQKYDQVKAPFLQHALFISQFFTALSLALRDHPFYSLTSWQQGKNIYEQVVMKGKAVSLRPDAFFVLREALPHRPAKAHYFLLEADRGTVRERTMLERYQRYWAYWKRLNNEARVAQGRLSFGPLPEQPRVLPIEHAFRVLTVTLNRPRADNLTRLARQADDDKRGSRMFYFSQAQWSLAEPRPIIAAIWQNPADNNCYSIL